jgi:hypothetical protein
MGFMLTSNLKLAVCMKYLFLSSAVLLFFVDGEALTIYATGLVLLANEKSCLLTVGLIPYLFCGGMNKAKIFYFKTTNLSVI